MAVHEANSSSVSVNFEDRYSHYTLPDTAEPIRNEAKTASPSTPTLVGYVSSRDEEPVPTGTERDPVGPALVAMPAAGFSQEALLQLNHGKLARMAYHWQNASRINAERADHLETRVSILARELKDMRHQNTALHAGLSRSAKAYRTLKIERDMLRQQVINPGGFPMVIVSDSRPALPA